MATDNDAASEAAVKVRRRQTRIWIVVAIYVIGIATAIGIFCGADAAQFEPHIAFFASAGILVVLGYGLPTFVALGRRHRRWSVILVANVLVGFTGIGWLFCLAAALGFVRVPKQMQFPRPDDATRMPEASSKQRRTSANATERNQTE